jgi:hypothetical protein
MTQYPLYKRLGGPQGPSGWVGKISSTPGFNPQITHSVASRYTAHSIPARKHKFILKKKTIPILLKAIRDKVDFDVETSDMCSTH